MSDELVTFLRARIDEDEAAAKAVDSAHDAFNGTGIIVMHLHGGGTRSVTLNSEMARYLLRSNPARVLREVGVKRRIIEVHAGCGSGYGYCDDGGHVSEGGSCFDLRVQTIPYADREGFRPEWAD